MVIFCCEVNSAPPGRITANLHIPSLISVTSLLALRAHRCPHVLKYCVIVKKVVAEVVE